MRCLDYGPMGNGPDLVLLHGFAMNAPFLKPLAEKLSFHYRVHLFDLPGFGSQHREQLPENIPALAEYLLKQIPVQKAIWIGWSLGGLIATWIALHYPNAVTAIINMNSSPYFLLDRDWPGIEPAAFLAFSQALQNNYETAINRFITLQESGLLPCKKDAQFLRTLIKKQPKPSQKTLSTAMQLLAQTDLRPKISSISPPCLYLLGEKDRLVPASIIQHLKGNQLKACLISEASHLPFFSHPELLLSKLQSFLFELNT